MWQEIVIVALVSYGVWLLGERVYSRLKPKKKTLPQKPKRHLTPEQLLGKCRNEARQSPTNIRTNPIAQQANEKADTFAGDKKNESPDSLLMEEVDEPFSTLDIPDVPLEYKEKNDNSNLGEEAEEIRLSQDGKEVFAQGMDWSVMLGAFDAVNRIVVTQHEEERAGEALTQMEGTELMDQLRSDPQRSVRIDELIRTSFERLTKTGLTQENPFAEPTGRAGDFDIRNYIN